MAPLEPDPSRLQPISVVAPILRTPRTGDSLWRFLGRCRSTSRRPLAYARGSRDVRLRGSEGHRSPEDREVSRHGPPPLLSAPDRPLAFCRTRGDRLFARQHRPGGDRPHFHRGRRPALLLPRVRAPFIESTWRSSGRSPSPDQRSNPARRDLVDYTLSQRQRACRDHPGDCQARRQFGPGAGSVPARRRPRHRPRARPGDRRGDRRLAATASSEGAPFDSYYLSLTPSFRASHASIQEIEELLARERCDARYLLRNLRSVAGPGGGASRRQWAAAGGAPGLMDCLSVYGRKTGWMSTRPRRRCWRRWA